MADQPQKDNFHHFTYAAQASQYRAMAVAIAVLGVVEGALMIALLIFLTHGLVRTMGLAPGAVLFVSVLSMLFSPLVTRHAPTAQNLILHLGLGFKAVIPREEIASANAANVKLPGSRAGSPTIRRKTCWSLT
jgi:hypothetical protein